MTIELMTCCILLSTFVPVVYLNVSHVVCNATQCKSSSNDAKCSADRICYCSSSNNSETECLGRCKRSKY